MAAAAKLGSDSKLSHKARTTGERTAVRNNSWEPVDRSGQVLRGRTRSARAGRKPDAHPPISVQGCEAPLPPQHKSGQGRGDRVPAGERRERESASGLPQGESAGRVASALIDVHSLFGEDLSVLIRFFQTLDRWDREARHGS
jgi:hypothetical protein